MTFLNPWVLLGLAATALPILLHLLTLKKLRTIEFSSLRFLKELQRSRIRRLRLRQLLLLIFRTLLLVALVLAFARPVLRGAAPGIPGTRAAGTVMIFLDDSPSMAVRDEQGVRFERARERARQILALAGESDNVIFSPLSRAGGPDALPEATTAAAARKRVDASTLTTVSVPWSAALAHARSVLGTAPTANRELFLITDAQAGQMRPRSTDTVAAFDPAVRVFLLPVSDRTLDNAGIAGVRIVSRILTPGRPVRLDAFIANHASAPRRDAVVSVYLDGARVAQTAVDLAPYAVTAVPFTVVPRRRGLLAGSVRIEDDVFDADNFRPFVLPIPDSIRILLAGESARDVHLPALALSLEGDSLLAGLMRLTIVPRNQLGAVDWMAFDVSILCGIRSFTAAEASRLGDFLRSGRGALVFTGPTIDPRSYSLSFGAWTAGAEFRSEAVLPDSASLADGTASFVSFTRIEMEHPLFQGLFERERSARKQGIESPRVYAAASLPEGPRARRIIGLSDGTPFLVEYSLPQGRLLIVAVNATGDESDFPFKGLFAPLMFRVAMYLSSGTTPSSDYRAGERLRFQLDPGRIAGPIVLRHPSGSEERPIPSGVAGSPGLESSPAMETGIYALSTPASGGSRQRILALSAVAIDTVESDLRPATDDEREKLARAFGISPGRMIVVPPTTDPAKSISESRFGVELWAPFLVIALLCVCAELLLARVPGAEKAAP